METSQKIAVGIEGDKFAKKLQELKAHVVDYCKRAKTSISDIVVVIELDHKSDNSDGDEVVDTLKVSLEDNAAVLDRELVMEIDL